MRIAICTIAAGLVFAACTKNSGGVYACSSNADCRGATGELACIEGYCRVPPRCGANLTACGAGCVDVQSDPANCGGCGNVCIGSPAVCRAGACAVSSAVTPRAVLDSPTPTSAPSASLHVADCTGLGSILIAATSSPPTARDAGWIPCSSASLSVLLAAEGANTIFVWGKNPEGVVSTAPAAVQVVRDTTPPVVALNGLAAGQTIGADSAPLVNLTLTDGSGIAFVAVEGSYDGNWAQLVSITGVPSGTQALVVPLPAVAGSLQLRVRARDGLSNEGFTAIGTVNLVDCDPAGAPFGGGRGTAAHPYRICSVPQLKAVSGAIDLEFQLRTELDLGSSPNVQLGVKVNGTFDGNGHTISGYSLTMPPAPAGATSLTTGAGLFSVVGNDLNGRTGTGAVRNLSLAVVSIDAADYAAVGAIAGLLSGSGAIDNCHVSISDHVAARVFVGGLVGLVEAGATVSNSTVTGSGGVRSVPTSVSGNVVTGRAGGAVGADAGAVSNVTVSGISVDGGSNPGNYNSGGAIGVVRKLASATGLLIQNVTVSGFGNIGGAVGYVAGAVTNVVVSSSTVSSVSYNAGGAVGLIDGGTGSFTTVSGSSVTSQTAHGAGGIAGALVNAGSLTDSTATANQIAAIGEVGGAVGFVKGSSLARVFAAGRSRLSLSTVVGPIGGLVGGITGGSIARAGADSVMVIDGSGNLFVNAGGLVGATIAPGGAPVTISQTYARPLWAITNVTNGQFGGLLAGIGPDYDSSNHPIPGGSVTVSDSYVDAEMPAPAPSIGANGGLIGGIDTTVAVTVQRAFSFGSGQPDRCVLSAFWPASATAPAFTGVFYNGDRCVHAPSTQDAAVASPVQQSLMANPASFTGYGFGSVWKMGAAHPRLAFEGKDSSPTATWTPPPNHFGAGASSQLAVTVGPGGAAQAVVEISFDGGRSWIPIGLSGPLPPGAAQIAFYLPDANATALLRLRLVDASGFTAVLPPATVSILTFDPAGAPFGGGLGTSANPFRIGNAAQLAQVANAPGSSFILESDIAVSGALSLGYFQSGTLDGNGHTISGLALAPGAGGGDVGLFKGIGNGPGQAIVQHLTLQVNSISVPGGTNVGAVAGHLSPGGSIRDCHVFLKGTISAGSAVGGLVGFGEGGTVINCSVALAPNATSGGIACDGGTGGGGVGTIGGAIGNILAGESASGISVTGISVSCPAGNNVGGIAGSVNGALSNSTASQVSVSGSFNAGGAIGSFIPASTVATGLLVQDAQVSGTSNSAGGLIGSIGSTPAGTVLSSSEARRVSVSGSANVGGAVGFLSGQELDNVIVTGRGVISGAIAVSGLVGGTGNNGFTLYRCGTDAFISGTPQPAGGLIGSYYPSGGNAAVLQSYSRVTIAGTNASQGGRAGGFFGDVNGSGTLSIADSYAVVSLPQATGLLTGGIFAGLNNQGSFTLSMTNVFAIAQLPAGHCIAAGAPKPLPATTSVFWNSDLCSWTDPSGTGIAGSAFANQSTFTGANYNFTPGTGIWAMGPSRPQLAWEPPAPATPPLSASWSAPAQLGAGSSYSLTVVVNSTTGVAQAFIEMSLDNKATWTLLGSAGPLSTGPAQIAITVPNVAPASGYLRLRLVGADGSTAIVQPITPFNLVLCDSTTLPFGGGNGTPEAPYRICSAPQLAKLSSYDNANATFRLETDLNLLGAPMDLGYFVSGTFDGNGHTISGVSITDIAPNERGLFRGVGHDPHWGTPLGTAVVKGLTIQVAGVSVPGSYGVAGLVGHLAQGGTVDNCGARISGLVQGKGAVGGLVGSNAGGTISNSVVTLDSAGVIQAASNAGALAGYLSPGSALTNSNVNGSGKVICDGTINGVVGGAVGTVDWSSLISGISVDGITVSCPTGSAGGLSGPLDYNASAASALVVSNVKVSGLHDVGGIATAFNGPTYGVSITNSTVTSTGDQQLGQNFCGGAAASVASSLVNATVQNVQINCPKAANVGGVVGLTQVPGGSVSGAKVIGTTVLGCNATGGLVGSVNGGGVQNGTIDATSIVQLSAGCIGGGGIVGWLMGGTVSQSGSLALIKAGANSGNVAGVVGWMNLTNPGLTTALVRQCYSRSTFAVSGAGSVGGIVGSAAGRANDPTATVTIEDSYTDQDLSAVPSAQAGGIMVGENVQGGVVVANVFVYGKSPTGNSGTCTVQTFSNLTASGVFWNPGGCTASGVNAGSAQTNPWNQTSSFPTYVFPTTYLAPWVMGTIHPVLAWEP